MKENNINAPYIFKEVRKKNKIQFILIFFINLGKKRA